MAYSTKKRSLCKVCNKLPSIFNCPGCQKDFCTDHAKEHRHELSNQLETIIIEHDQLKQNLTEYTGNSNLHPLMEEINQWETESIEKIRKAATDARKQLSNVLGNHTSNIKEDLNNLTQELNTARSENNFIEIDLNEWMERLKQYTKDLRTPSSISIQQENSCQPFIQKILVNLKKTELFEQMAGNAKIEDHGQVVIVESNGHSTARCQGEYSSGQHKLRFKIEQKHASNWMHFGIVSKNTPLQATSYTTPTNFGWITNSYISLNSAHHQGYNGFKSDIDQNDIIELFLDCDQRKIRLTNERTNSKHEIDVNVTQCPFPWNAHIGLHYQNDRVRYLSS